MKEGGGIQYVQYLIGQKKKASLANLPYLWAEAARRGRREKGKIRNITIYTYLFLHTLYNYPPRRFESIYYSKIL